MNFNSGICQAAAKMMEYLTEFVFISMGNLTLARRDAYLTHLKMGVKPDTLAALLTSPMHISTIFPDSVIKRAEEEIANFESKGHTSGSRGKGQSGQVEGLPMQKNHSDCSRVAQHALVLGSSDHVQPNPTEPALSAQPVNTALQSDPSQNSDKPKSPCMAPRASAIKEQGFSEAVAARIEAQRGSTRSVYEAKWAIFTKWCITNQVDFRAPPVKSAADFLMYLFQDRKLQSSTIDGYRSAIATGQLVHQYQTKISLVSWIVSIGTDPKPRGKSPPGT